MRLCLLPIISGISSCCDSGGVTGWLAAGDTPNPLKGVLLFTLRAMHVCAIHPFILWVSWASLPPTYHFWYLFMSLCFVSVPLIVPCPTDHVRTILVSGLLDRKTSEELLQSSNENCWEWLSHDRLTIDTRSESFNDWGGRGCRKIVPVLGGDSTKITPPGDIFDQPPCEIR